METHEPWQNVRMRVKTWMSAPKHCVEPDTPVDEAFRLMRAHNIRHLLVMTGAELVGVITDRDLRQPNRAGRPWTITELYLVGRELRVASVMTTAIVSVDEEDNAAYAARLMVDHKIGCLPVLSQGEVVGIVTSSDLLKALSYAVDPDASWDWESARSAQ